MTAKEQLRERIERLTEDEAAETLRLLEERTDPLTGLLNDATPDDEPITPDEEAAVQLAREEIAQGETISLDGSARSSLPSGERLPLDDSVQQPSPTRYQTSRRAGSRADPDRA
jgi:hypothetical protein